MSNLGKSNKSTAVVQILPSAATQSRRVHLLVTVTITLLALAFLWAVPGYGSTSTIETAVKGDSSVLPDSLPDMNVFIPVDTQPELIYRHPPDYPRIAENARIEGKVYVKTLVNEAGEVLKAAVLKSSGNVWLDRAAQKAATKNKYKPAVYQGKPIMYWATYKVDFVLGE